MNYDEELSPPALQPVLGESMNAQLHGSVPAPRDDGNVSGDHFELAPRRITG